jgi:uncharacterized protein (TIGR03435 family)
MRIRFRIRGLAVFASVAVLVMPSTLAQLAHPGPAAIISLSQTLPPYDVSSVKVNNSGEGTFSLTISDSGNRLRATNVPIEMLIEYAYDVKADHILGLSAHIKDAHFDVEAKVLPTDDGKPPKLTDQQLQAMMIPLLGDRFHLKAHLETKVFPVYELVVARDGPKLKLSTEAATSSSMNMSSSDTNLVLDGKTVSMPDLAQALSDLVHRQVIDKTNLAGRSDLTLKWTSDEALDQGGNVLSIFTAIEEQLGLKLVSSKGPVATLVIDHIEMPAED